METKKVGYFASYLTSKSKEELKKWLSNYVSSEDLFFAEINGKTEGGEVVDKAHITLFYGLDDNKVSAKNIELLIHTNLIPETITAGNIKTFPTPIPGSKILVLAVEDTENYLFNLHNKIKNDFVYFPEEYKEYIPHITLAYIKDDFDISKIDTKTLAPLFLGLLEYRAHTK